MKTVSTTEIDEAVELLAQILLTVRNCKPDFNKASLDNVLEFLGIKKRDRTHMYKFCLSNASLALISEIERQEKK